MVLHIVIRPAHLVCVNPNCIVLILYYCTSIHPLVKESSMRIYFSNNDEDVYYLLKLKDGALWSVKPHVMSFSLYFPLEDRLSS